MSVLELAKKHRQKETDIEIETYVKEYGDKFYVYWEKDEVKGYCDYFVIDDELTIYDLVCEGNLFRMWKYCKQFMKDNKIKTIRFKRSGVWRSYHGGRRREASKK